MNNFVQILLLSVFSLIFNISSFAQENNPPKREFRGVWIATVANIDWPSKPNLTTEQQKNELITILDKHEKQGLNAVMFQVRPATDAFYAKTEEHWSYWLTGKQGNAPNPFYDPLEFAIEEAHKRGMELHAWFNPYRATTDNNLSRINKEHLIFKKPEWFFTYGGKKLFNPGIPEVREYITQIVTNVVKNYDVDGIHFDDYFYPYGEAGQVINDEQAFKNYNNGFSNKADWRRNNVDVLIKMVGDSVHHYKKYVKYGISPFGIWLNKRQNAEGSETKGGDSYHGNFADSRKWAKEGWIDYINPQIYWSFSSVAAPYAKLIDWWSENSFGKHLYIGHGAYRLTDSNNRDFAWKKPTQIPEQIAYNRNNSRVQGSIYFSSKSITSNKLGVSDSLSNNYYKYPALPPVMLWLDSIAPNRPENLLGFQHNHKIVLAWKQPSIAKDSDRCAGYVIYRFDKEDAIDLDKTSAIKKIYYSNITSWEDENIELGKTYKYVVTAIDRIKNESEHSIPIEIITENKENE